jgi:N-acetyl-anhydromuramyl-L-alanine amidase AmpD
VDADTLEQVIANDLNSMEANLKRHGYDMKELSTTLDVKPSEIRSFFRGRLSSDRAQERECEILKLGLVGAQ